MNKKNTLLITSTYSLKSRFQTLLMPIRDWAIRQGYTPNQVTLLSVFLCSLYSVFLIWSFTSVLAMIFLPLFLLIRMALNALDGIIATQTQKKTPWGAVLNEIGDIVSDLVLFGAFLTLIPAYIGFWLFLMLLCLLTEFVSLAVFQAVGIRPNTGPFGKSDRAVFLAIVSISIVLFPDTLITLQIYLGLGVLLAVVTIMNRLKLNMYIDH